MATKKKTTEYPIITKGSHLTVIQHENGKIDLEWDDAQLLKDVEEALASVGESKPKKTRKKKVEAS